LIAAPYSLKSLAHSGRCSVADIRSEELFFRGRWKWTAFGYEQGIRPCAFGDIDAHLERNHWHLFIEAKHWDGKGHLSKSVPKGQWIALESLISYGHTVWLLIGDAPENNPLYLRMWHKMDDGRVKQLDDDYQGLPLEERRQRLRQRINDWYAFANTAKARRAA